MLGNVTWRRRKAEREIGETLFAHDRFVDCGLVLRVVEASPEGRELIAGKPKLRVLREHRYGGIVDTRAAEPHFVGPSARPVVWYCSEDQERVLLHDDDVALRQLVRGSMGAGKTTTGAMWLWLRVIEWMGHRDATVGVTAPTTPRLDEVKRVIGGSRWNGSGLWPKSWWHWHERSGILSTCLGVSLHFTSTHQTSADAGSRIQAFNWFASYNDELQDYFEVDGDIDARGRAAPGGRYKRFASVTVKDHAGWRTFRDRITQSPVWKVQTLLGPRSPFIAPSFWDQLKSTMSPREYDRKVLAREVGPERMVYTQWSREHNLRMIPSIGARDVTEQVLRRRLNAPLRMILGGHDPGKLVDVTELVKIYDINGEGIVYFVVGEVETKQTTAEQHADSLAKVLQSKYACQMRPGEEQIHIRCDPYGASDRRPDKDVYKIFKRMGFDIMAAEYSKAGTGTGMIKVEARVEMLNRLLCNYAGERRLFVACDEKRVPAAPKLVEALEQMERDEMGNAEWQRKGEGDLSHYVSGLSYALWPFEKEATQKVTHGIA